MKKIIFIGVILLILSSCKEDKIDNDSNFVIKDYTKDVNCNNEEKLISDAILKGDTMAYMTVYSDYWREEKSEDLLYVSLIMANKYNYVGAYYDLYAAFVHSNFGADIDKLDEKTKYFALYFLLKAKEKGDERALNEAKEFFKETKIPSSNFYLLKLAEDSK